MRAVRSLGSVALIAVLVSLLLPARAQAATEVLVPMATKVPLSFINKLDSQTAKEGQTVRMRVAADVVVSRRVVIRKGASAQGLISSVSPPGIFGQNARVHIAFIKVTAVDNRPVRVSPVDITPDSLKETADTGGAVATSAAGLILLGPIGIAAGALVRGGHVSVPPGAVAVTATLAAVRIKVP